MEWDMEELDAITRQVLAQIDTESLGRNARTTCATMELPRATETASIPRSRERRTVRESMYISAKRLRENRYISLLSWQFRE